MQAYGLNGFSESLGSTNTVCPNVQQNCCGEKDQDLILAYFSRDRKHIENYYRSVLLPFKYILGFGRQYEKQRYTLLAEY